MKNIYAFELDQAKKLVPIVGNTFVTVETDGEYDIIDCRSTYYRGPREILLARTAHAKLTRSPMGLNRSVHVHLPAELCTCEEVVRQVRKLFGEY